VDRNRVETVSVESTWTTRDLPILAAALRLLDDPGNHFAGFEDIQTETGLRRSKTPRATPLRLESPMVLRSELASYLRIEEPTSEMGSHCRPE
jgi:hypothetical protein